MLSLDWQQTDIAMNAYLPNGRQLASILPSYNRYAVEIATARNAYVPTIVHHVDTVHDGMVYVERLIAPQEAADTANVLSREQFQILLGGPPDQLLRIVRALGVDTRCEVKKPDYGRVLKAAYIVRADALRLITNSTHNFRFIKAVAEYQKGRL